ncbi:adenosylmethionine decarboxylase [Candidatus Woesearchaeota archaeon]|nr:adenosylmethionine decarboxylase [Candidatus Woesearchaeota archaeon]
MKGFGPHLTLDLKGCNVKKLVDEEFVKKLLEELPAHIGLKTISEPKVMTYLDKFASTPGVTGFIVLAESHFSIHTFPDSKYVFVDVFSCREYGYQEARDIIIKAFEAESYDENVIKRGLDFQKK